MFLLGLTLLFDKSRVCASIYSVWISNRLLLLLLMSMSSRWWCAWWWYRWLHVRVNMGLPNNRIQTWTWYFDRIVGKIDFDSRFVYVWVMAFAFFHCFFGCFFYLYEMEEVCSIFEWRGERPVGREYYGK